MTRETLEQRARRLGVPFTADTVDGELEAICAVAETERPLPPIEELVKSIGGKLPGCYAEMWDGCGSAGCAGCDAERHCRRDYFEALNDLLHKAGLTRQVDIKEMAEALDIHPDSVVVALRGSTPAKTERKRASIKLVVEQQGEVQALTSEEIVAAAVDDKPAADGPVTDDTAVEGGEKSVVPAEAPAAEPEPNAGPMEEQVEVQTEKPAKKARAKAKPKAPKGKAPLQAKAPAKSAKVKAPTKKAKAKPAAKPVKAPALKRSSNGESATDPFARERARSPWVRSLRTGEVLKRPMADGSVVRIKVGAHEYKDLDTGAVYPTLYKVVCEKAGVSRFPVRDQAGVVIPGKFREMPNYSAQRWFNRADG